MTTPNRPNQPQRSGPGGHGPMGGGPRMMMPGEKARDFKGTMRKLLQFLKPYRASILIVMVFAAFSTAGRLLRTIWGCHESSSMLNCESAISR